MYFIVEDCFSFTTLATLRLRGNLQLVFLMHQLVTCLTCIYLDVQQLQQFAFLLLLTCSYYRSGTFFYI
ncbi:hypothetical protein Pint_02040 [Pistacia integerrima]|uniref:Uncharacterized protein n=1 Tax=Pistacia integerrima TaxID=434235 RepID=A0ACC0ZMV9_9ROSI|nr:hypothetical protein Pint_02040 [Pistacia integerrima]